MGDLKYIFVHGLSGWGSYDKAYKRMPYWGMRGGDLIAYLRERGFDCYAASVSPTGSAWDRACELYAQLYGTVTDYGEAHSRTFRHGRFGPDFTGRPLLPAFGRDTKLALLGHSFGGTTIRVFAHLMSEGSERERRNTDGGYSPFFAGGSGSVIHSLVTLATPHNGTTAYDLFEDPSFDPRAVKAPVWSEAAARMMSMGTRPKPDGRDPRDYAGFDMHIDNADTLNRSLTTDPGIYYFSVPCSATTPNERKDHVPDEKLEMEPLFVKRSCQIGAYAGRTKGGILLDEAWKENDGLVNTISAMAPSHAPVKDYDPERMEAGVWQIMPTYRGDHMALQGGLFHRNDIRDFYLRLLTMIEGGSDVKDRRTVKTV